MFYSTPTLVLPVLVVLILKIKWIYHDFFILAFLIYLHFMIIWYFALQIQNIILLMRLLIDLLIIFWNLIIKFEIRIEIKIIFKFLILIFRLRKSVLPKILLTDSCQWKKIQRFILQRVNILQTHWDKVIVYFSRLVWFNIFSEFIELNQWNILIFINSCHLVRLYHLLPTYYFHFYYYIYLLILFYN